MPLKKGQGGWTWHGTGSLPGGRLPPWPGLGRLWEVPAAPAEKVEPPGAEPLERVAEGDPLAGR